MYDCVPCVGTPLYHIPPMWGKMSTSGLQRYMYITQEAQIYVKGTQNGFFSLDKLGQPKKLPPRPLTLKDPGLLPNESTQGGGA